MLKATENLKYFLVLGNTFIGSVETSPNKTKSYKELKAFLKEIILRFGLSYSKVTSKEPSLPRNHKVSGPSGI